MALDSLAGFFSLDIFSQTYAGSSIGQYALFLGVVLAAAILGKAASFFAKVYLRRLAEKTKNNFDDFLIDIIEKPILLVFIIPGLYFGGQFLSLPPEIAPTYFNLIGVLAVFAGVWVSLGIIDGIIRHFVKPFTEKTETKLDDQIIPVVSRTLKIGVIGIALIIIMDSFGYDVTAIIAGLGIGGLAFAFAAKDTIANLFGGASIFAGRQFHVGDIIEIEGVLGIVEEIGIRITKIRDFDGRIISMPNANVANATIKNITSEPSKRIVMVLGLVYSTSLKDMQKALQILAKIVDSHPGCENSPDAHFDEFADSSLNIRFAYKIKDKGNWRVIKHEINLAVMKEFEKAKLEFAYPSQSIYLEK